MQAHLGLADNALLGAHLTNLVLTNKVNSVNSLLSPLKKWAVFPFVVYPWLSIFGQLNQFELIQEALIF